MCTFVQGPFVCILNIFIRYFLNFFFYRLWRGNFRLFVFKFFVISDHSIRKNVTGYPTGIQCIITVLNQSFYRTDPVNEEQINIRLRDEIVLVYRLHIFIYIYIIVELFITRSSGPMTIGPVVSTPNH